MDQAIAPNPGQMLSHYRLVEKIGEGGMGMVWKAEDTVLGRTVAIKVLPPGAASDDQRRKMFLDEARLASSVSEAHIVQVHEFGREGDLDFIVMEFVDGKPLSKILHGRPLPPDKVASMGLQAARALSRAHRKGLLHRDLKPANLLITNDGDLKVVDFGLATLFEHRVTSVGSDESTYSTNGEAPAGSRRMPVAGTLPYMSPEQVRAENLDARSDVFSLGVVIYEMTTGQRPFAGATHGELVQEILRGRPRPVHELVPKVPLELDRIVQKALAARPGERYQTMEDLAVDMKRLGRDLESGSSPSYDDLKEALAPARRRRLRRAALAAALALGVTAVIGWLTRDRWSAARPDPRSVLILPLEVRGQPEGAEYVGRAFAEALAIHLARIGGLRVLPVPAGPLKGGGNPPDVYHASLGAGAARLLTGSVTRRDRALFASLSLVDTSSNRILWGAQKDSAEGDLPSLASHLAREAAVAMGATLPRQYESIGNLTGGPAMSKSPLTSESIGAFLVDDAASMLDATGRLVESFPDEPDAWTLRAYALVNRWHSDPSPSNTKAVEDCLAAIERLDGKSPYPPGFRAFLDVSGAGRHREAIARLTPLLGRDDLSPSVRAWILRQRAGAESNTGDITTALADLEQAIDLDPTASHSYEVLSGVLRDEGHPEECVARAQQAVALRPFYWRHHLSLALCLGDLGRHEEALIHQGKACDLSRAQNACGAFAIALFKTGQPAKGRAAAEAAATLTDSIYGCYNLACYWALAGDRGEALRFLRRSLGLGLSDMVVSRDADLASLHGDPGFEAIAAEVGRRTRKPAL